MSIFDLFDLAKTLIEKMGYFGVFLGTFLESVFPPIPSEVIMGFSGFLISEGRFSWFPTLFAAILGNMASVSLLWYLGNKYGRGFILKIGKYGGFTENDIDRGEKLFAKYGYMIVLGCQLLPLARSWIAIPAGTLKTNYFKFIFFNTLGASIWLSVLCYVGYTLGKNWEEIEMIFKPYERFFLLILAAILIYIVYKFFRSRIVKKA